MKILMLSSTCIEIHQPSTKEIKSYL